MESAKNQAVLSARERIGKIEDAIALLEKFPDINAKHIGIGVFGGSIFINVDCEGDLREWEKYLQDAGWERVGYPNSTPLTTSLKYKNSIAIEIELVMPNELFWRR